MTRAFSLAVLAAGRGNRMGGIPKQFRCLGDRPLWLWSVQSAREAANGLDAELLLVLPPDLDEATREEITAAAPDIRIVLGGATRTASALAALRAATGVLVALHDAARPFASPELWSRLLAAAGPDRGAVACTPLTDAIKRRGENGWQAVDRRELFATQTPQVFPREALLALLEAATSDGWADEAEAWLADGRELAVIDGEELNRKITRPGDWLQACALVERPTIRVGLGYDVHPLTPDRPLILGGLSVPSPLGLAGHSDADLLSHAATDALLSAAGLPDIGTLYPASDARYSGCRSLDLLADALDRTALAGWAVEFVSMTLSAQIPRLAGWHDAIVKSLESVLGQGRLSLTFKSGEAVGPVGRGDAMIAWATATLRREN